MNSANDFRSSRIGVLELLSDPSQQRAFAERVHYDDYATEFLNWWLDDFHPDSDTFRAAFSARKFRNLAT